ncbi:hypothetical protein E2C01_087577 [Portunus trituberculatus]|uniref:Uncharacterized protein n=1 Tax=Portunus trituberculatus TaxID=210409 RepID=A0A5B7JEE7_PORTR|nr:hypothetical protein [Portunus trituberculatus]
MEGDHIEQPEQQQQQLQQDRSPSTAILSTLLLNFESLTEQIEPLAIKHLILVYLYPPEFSAIRVS